MSQNPSDVSRQVQALLGQGEQLVVVIPTPQRIISVTNRRLFLHESSGMFSTIRHASISAVEVSSGRGSEKFVKLFFGDLSRTISTPDDSTLAALLRVLGTV